MSRFPNRKYVIFDLSETGSIDFNQVMETSADTLRLNVSQSKSFVKYERPSGSAVPSSINGLSSKSSEYTHTEIINILTGSEWVSGSGL